MPVGYLMSCFEQGGEQISMEHDQVEQQVGEVRQFERKGSVFSSPMQHKGFEAKPDDKKDKCKGTYHQQLNKQT